MEPTASPDEKLGLGICWHIWIEYDEHMSHFKCWRFVHTYLTKREEGQRYCFIDFHRGEVKADANE